MDITRLIHQDEHIIAPAEPFEGFSWVQRRRHKAGDDIPLCRKRRRPTPPTQRQMLEDIYRETRYPSAEMRRRLAAIHHTTSRKIQIWFQNRRMKEKNDAARYSHKDKMMAVTDILSAPRHALEAEKVFLQDRTCDPRVSWDNVVRKFPTSILELSQTGHLSATAYACYIILLLIDMRSVLFTLTLLSAALADGIYMLNVTDVYTESSKGGNAFCTIGNVIVQVTAPNLDIGVSPPADQYEATEMINTLESIRSKEYIRAYVSSKFNTVRNYSIAVKLCAPSYDLNAVERRMVHILVHGIGFDKSYWDFEDQYSYIDQAGARGEWTFSFDRLATGNSSYPDAVSDVQSPTEVSILSVLINHLRTGYFGVRFNHVVGVGHSYGSLLINGLLKQEASALDAVVMTGYTAETMYSNMGLASLDLVLANSTSRFAGLTNGYFVPENTIGVQQSFYTWPNFETSILNASTQNAQPVSLGTFFTMGSLLGATSYTSPVLVLNGRNDYFFCGGDCKKAGKDGSDASAAVQLAIFPRSRNFRSETLEITGHGIALHKNAAYSNGRILDFIYDAIRM
ncbi:hypothetical protein PROFUN_00368 [Planoprotostelium fungivorum]|uniref:Homeobox domain-containing protein n=1 Tax=Planoprotostelium fungivorum TaxID=1890364 RepID=A0A2P6NY68_9EUKA|nr:hypothetical protein PROFUN_00368 [Planoprotostelium fungivorum]